MKKTTRTLLKFILFILCFSGAWYFLGCSASLFFSRSNHLGDLVLRMFPPAWSYLPKILTPLFYTIQMSVTGTFIGAVCALILAPHMARNLHTQPFIRQLLRIIIQILRSFPALILALIATFFFGLGTFAGTAAITLYTFAIMTRLTYEDIENTGIQAYEALLCMGSRPYPACCQSILPEIMPSYLSNTLYLLETNVRHSSILGYVGAGGIGLLLNEKISWKEYDKVGMMLIVLFITVLAAEGLAQLCERFFHHHTLLTAGKKRMLCLLLISIFLLCTCTINPPDFSHTSLQTIQRMLFGLVHPDLAFFFSFSKEGLLYLLLETVCIAFLGTILGTVIAVPLSFLGTARLTCMPAAVLIRTVIAAVRCVPFFVYGLIFIRVTGPGASAGVLTMTMCSIGLLTKRFTEALSTMDYRGSDALAAMGIPGILRIRHAIIPEIFRTFISAILYRFDVNIREAAVLGLVGAGGIGAPLIFAMNKYNWQMAGTILIGLIILVWAVDVISEHIRTTAA